MPKRRGLPQTRMAHSPEGQIDVPPYPSLCAGQFEVPPHPPLRAGPLSRGRPRSTRLRSASTTTARPGGTREYSIPQLPDFALVDASGQGSRARCGCSQTSHSRHAASPTRGGEAIAEPTPLEQTVPGPLAGGAVAAPCRPPRKAMGPVPCVTRTSPIVTARPTRNQRITPNIRGILLAPRPQTSNDESAPPRRSVPGGVRWRRFQPSSSPHGTLPPSRPARPRRRLCPVHRHPPGPIRRALTPRP
jgi:hypothetical protein